MKSTHLDSEAAGHGIIEFIVLLLVIASIGIAGWIVYERHVATKTTSSTASNGLPATFPTGHLSYTMPASWKSTLVDYYTDNSGGPGFGTTRQTREWGWTEYSIEITSHNTINIQPLKPEVACLKPDLCDQPYPEPNVTVYIGDFGTNSYTTAAQWYQQSIGKTFTDPRNGSYVFGEGGGSVFKNQQFAGRSAYCVSFPDGTPANMTLPDDLPQDILLGGCYIRWANRIYYIQADTIVNSPSDHPKPSELPADVNRDRAELVQFLRSFRFQ